MVSDPRAGAIVTFQGTTREVSRIDYEAYREMAHQQIAEIAADCVRHHGLCAAAVEHRIGAVALGGATRCRRCLSTSSRDGVCRCTRDD